jgi:1-acyl-sn-glycerol-3-phosphate acyltransferase
MTAYERLYNRWYKILNALSRVFFPYSVTGREKLPRGRALVCANHSSNLDPVLLPLAAGAENKIHILGKIQVFRIPLLGKILRKVGMLSVDRDANDVAAIRQITSVLKNDEKVAIFPEGHRYKDETPHEANSGVIRFAALCSAPLVPVYIPRKKRFLRRTRIVIGDPYFINAERKKLGAEDYSALTAELMEKIRRLGAE